MPALRTIVAAIVAVGVGVLASGALAAPSAGPQPTPPPSTGGGGSSGGGGGGGGTTRPTVRRPVGPVAVANGRAGAVLLEATGERTKEPTAAVTPPATTTPPPATTAETPATTAEAPATTAAPVTTAQAPVTTAEVPPPTTTAGQPAGVVSSGGDDSGMPTLPRDGIVVLVGVLLLGLGIALRAIRSRERRIGWALLGFCVVYLLALAGLVTGVAGAATLNPAGFGATAGDGETLLTFDPPPAGFTLVVRRAAGAVPPATCSAGTAVAIASSASGSEVDGPLANGTRVSYRACLADGTGASAGTSRSAAAGPATRR